MDPIKIIERIHSERYRWLDVQYTDFLGFFKHITIPASSLDVDSFKDGTINISYDTMFYDTGDYLSLIPDPNTFSVIPWEPSTVRLIAHTNSPNDPRNILAAMSENSKKNKLAFELGSETDFYLMDSLVTDNSRFSYGAFFDSREISMSQYTGILEHGMRKNQTMNADLGKALRLQVGDYAELVDVRIGAMHHEKGRMQHEISLLPSNPIKAADDFITLKYLTKNAAMLVGAIATFAPKVSNDEPMNEMHISVSCWKGDENIFLDMSGEPLTSTGYHFLAGIADHIPALSAFLLPSTLSYKDMLYTEQIGVLNNIVRIPPAIKGEVDKRVEYRFADPSLNPYLGYAVLLAAGMDGINKKTDFDDKRNITVPHSLTESLSSLLSDHDFLRGVLSDDVLNAYIDLKEKEVKEISSKVSGYEITRYQNI
ncbi:MAG: hypothetical protein ACP5KJ_03335 [Candidatus Micrarchaeia archaeon]